MEPETINTLSAVYILIDFVGN